MWRTSEIQHASDNGHFVRWENSKTIKIGHQQKRINLGQWKVIYLVADCLHFKTCKALLWDSSHIRAPVSDYQSASWIYKMLSGLDKSSAKDHLELYTAPPINDAIDLNNGESNTWVQMSDDLINKYFDIVCR